MTLQRLEKVCSAVLQWIVAWIRSPARQGRVQNLAFSSRAPFLILHRAASSVTGWRRSEQYLWDK
ncbi:hypothetical protein ACQKWADRAFT_297955 [Trichoderma austrokoningii]